MRPRSSCLIAPLAILGSLAACDDDADGLRVVPVDAAPPAPDASDPEPDAASPGCGIDVALGDVGVLDGTVDDEDGLVAELILSEGPSLDLLAVLMSSFDGETPFGPGRYPLASEATSVLDCGPCVLIGADVVGSSARHLYIATSGVLDVSSVEGRFTGSLAPLPDEPAVAFAGLDPETGDLTECSTSLTAASFDLPVP